MRAAVIEQYGAPLVVREVPTPKIGPGDVLVKVGACGVCYTDVKIWKGQGYNYTMPHVMGHEIAGSIAEIGSDVKDIQKGDRVAVYLYNTCGKCAYCHAGRDNECIDRVGFIGSNRWGGYAEYALVRADNVLKIPDNLSFEEAGLLPDAALTPYHAIVDRAQVRINETALLVGIGGLALSGLQILKLCGARVIALSRTQSKLDLAKQLGADHIINSTKEDALETVKKLTGGYGVDHIFDFVGSTETVTQDTKYIKRGGKIYLLGYQAGENLVPVTTIRGFFSLGGSNGGTRKDLRELIHLASEGKIKSVVTKTYTLDEANTALNLLAHGEVEGRLSLKVS